MPFTTVQPNADEHDIHPANSAVSWLPLSWAYVRTLRRKTRKVGSQIVAKHSARCRSCPCRAKFWTVCPMSFASLPLPMLARRRANAPEYPRVGWRMHAIPPTGGIPIPVFAQNHSLVTRVDE